MCALYASGVYLAAATTRTLGRRTTYPRWRRAVSERLVTAAELGEHLALSTSTVLDWFEAGRLPGFKLGRVVRFRESEVVDWLEAQRG